MNASKLCAILLTVGSASIASAVPATYQRYIGTAVIEEGGANARTRDGGSVNAFVRRNTATGLRNIVVLKLDYKGATQWEVEVIRPDDETPLSITQTFDGGYALVADVTNAGAGLGLGILRLNPAGGFMWGQVWFGNPLGTGVHGAKIIETPAPANNLVIASRSSFGGGPVGQVPCIIQLNPAGGLIWAWEYIDARYTNAQYGSFMDIRPFRDPAGVPGFLACGWTQQAATAPREPLMMFVNGAGVNTFSNVYSPGGTDLYFNGLDIMPAGDVAATAVNATPDTVYYGFSPAMVLGPVMTLSRFKAANESIFAVPPAGVIIGGNDTTAAGNGALARVDVGGGIFQHMSFGGATADRVDQIAPASDGVFAHGTITSFTHGATDVWAFRSNTSLRTGCIEGPLAMPLLAAPPAIIPVPFNRTGMQFTPWQVQIVNVTDINTIICLKCPADFNNDGVVDFFDYLDFVDALSLGSSSADFNEDGVVDFFDYLDFVDSLSLGC